MARPALFQRNTMRRLALLAGAGLIGIAGLVLTDALLDLDGAFSFDGRLVFYAGFGWLVGLVVIAVAKALGAVLKRPPNYYDRAR